MENTKRIHLLSSTEVEELYARPAFNTHEQFSALAAFLDGQSFDKKAAPWEYCGKSSRIFSLHLRPICTTVALEYYKENSTIGGLIDMLKSHYASGKGPSDLKICDDLGFTVPKSMTQYLKRKPTDTHIDPYLFEFFVYQKIYHEIDRGRLYCNDSVSYCDIDTDLIDDTRARTLRPHISMATNIFTHESNFNHISRRDAKNFLGVARYCVTDR